MQAVTRVLLVLLRRALLVPRAAFFSSGKQTDRVDFGTVQEETGRVVACGWVLPAPHRRPTQHSKSVWSEYGWVSERRMKPAYPFSLTKRKNLDDHHSVPLMGKGISQRRKETRKTLQYDRKVLR